MKTIMKILVVLTLIALTESAPALTIIRDFMGGTPPTNSTGTGNITNIFNAACDVWEKAIQDDYTLVLHYGWAPVGGGQHVLNSQGGNPNREIEGTILFNNNNTIGNFSYWLDPTPLVNEEYTEYQEEVADLGGGPINVTRHFTGPVLGPQTDLFTTALHEIGHALGMSSANTSFIAEGVDLDIDIKQPLPFKNTKIPLGTNNSGLTSHIKYIPNTSGRSLMSGSFSSGERILPSELDIVALGQLSTFSKLNLSLTGVNMDPAVQLTISGPYIVNNNTGKPTTPEKVIILSWKKQKGSYVVEQTVDMKNWSTVNVTPSESSGVYNASITMTSNNTFYRLKRI